MSAMPMPSSRRGNFKEFATHLRDEREQVVILGANGTMGAGAATVFAGAGYRVTMLARDLDKARQGLAQAQSAARAEAVAQSVAVGTYESDLERALSAAAIVFESLAEDLALKRSFLAIVDRFRRPDSVIATGSSGLSIREMARERSDSFRRNFLGLHLFNPPHVIVGTEVIPGPDTDPAVAARTVAMLERRLLRKVIVAADRPAFVGNRVGFKMLNECAQLAVEHGVAVIDYLIGPHTGRAMAPLKTVDLVGWDVHRAIVDNVHENCEDEARACFRLPEPMTRAIAAGHLGDKTPERGGFYRNHARAAEVLDLKRMEYLPYAAPEKIGWVEAMKALNHVGRYREAMAALADARGAQAEICRRVVFGYVSYALNRVGEAARSVADVDRIMNYGFNWAPPSAIVDLLGARRTAELMKESGLAVPAAVERAASGNAKLCSMSVVEYGRTFVG